MAGFDGEVVDVPLIGCDRCAGNHDPIRVYPLTRPRPPDVSGPIFTHYGHCPENGEPLFVAFLDEDEGIASLFQERSKVGAERNG